MIAGTTARRLRVVRLFHSKVALQDRPFGLTEYRRYQLLAKLGRRKGSPRENCVAVIGVESFILGATMKPPRHVGTVFLSSVLGCLAQSPPAFSQTPPTVSEGV